MTTTTHSERRQLTVKGIQDPLRDAEALAYRAQGHTFQWIANTLGMTSRQGAWEAVQRALTTAPAENNEEARAFIVTDLLATKRACWAVLEANHITISNGVAVKVDGMQVPDDEPVLKAVDRLIKINQELAKIYGAYAPVQTEVVSMDAVEAEIRKLEAEIKAADRGKTHTSHPA